MFTLVDVRQHDVYQPLRRDRRLIVPRIGYVSRSTKASVFLVHALPATFVPTHRTHRNRCLLQPETNDFCMPYRISVFSCYLLESESTRSTFSSDAFLASCTPHPTPLVLYSSFCWYRFGASRGACSQIRLDPPVARLPDTGKLGRKCFRSVAMVFAGADRAM